MIVSDYRLVNMEVTRDIEPETGILMPHIFRCSFVKEDAAKHVSLTIKNGCSLQQFKGALLELSSSLDQLLDEGVVING